MTARYTPENLTGMCKLFIQQLVLGDPRCMHLLMRLATVTGADPNNILAWINSQAAVAQPERHEHPPIRPEVQPA